MGAEDWPLVHREPEFAAVRAALAGHTRFRGIVVVGNAGVGKTTLARQVTESLPNRVRWVAGTASSRGIPLGAFAHLVGLATARDPMAFLASARDALTAESGTLLVVDDAHLLDELSAMLLHQLALEGSVPMVVNVRAGEGGARRHYLAVEGRLSAAPRPGTVRQGAVRRVDRDGARRARGGAERGFDVPRLRRQCAVRAPPGGAAAEAGTLRRVRGVWQLRGRGAISPELASLVDERIEQLPDDVAHALGLLALCEPLDLDTLTSLVGAGAVEQAETRGLIRIAADRDVGLEVVEVRFNHLLLADVMRRRLGVAAARRLRGELVRALRDKPIRGPGERIRLAELTLDSDVTPDVDLLVAAAEDAISLTDIILGERLARAAVDPAPVWALVSCWPGACCGRARPPRPTTRSPESTRTRWTKPSCWGGQPSVCSTFKRSRAMPRPPNRSSSCCAGGSAAPNCRRGVDALAAASAAFAGRLEDAVEVSRRELSAPPGPPAALGWAVFAGGLALGLMGRGEQVAALAERGKEIEGQVDGVLRHLMAFSEVRAQLLMGEFDAAEKRCVDTGQISAPSQYLSWGLATMLAGAVDLASGHFVTAASRMEQTVAALSTESGIWWTVPRLVLAQAYCALGRPTTRPRSSPNSESAPMPTMRYGGHKCASPKHGLPRRRATSAAPSRRRRMPPQWPTRAASWRSKCWLCTTRPDSGTARACSV